MPSAASTTTTAKSFLRIGFSCKAASGDETPEYRRTGRGGEGQPGWGGGILHFGATCRAMNNGTAEWIDRPPRVIDAVPPCPPVLPRRAELPDPRRRSGPARF